MGTAPPLSSKIHTFWNKVTSGGAAVPMDCYAGRAYADLLLVDSDPIANIKLLDEEPRRDR
jgi:hypothetical protein